MSSAADAIGEKVSVLGFMVRAVVSFALGGLFRIRLKEVCWSASSREDAFCSLSLTVALLPETRELCPISKVEIYTEADG